MGTQKPEKPYGIRVPGDLLDAMKTLAKQHDRSLNSEIVRAIRVYVLQHQQQEKEKP